VGNTEVTKGDTPRLTPEIEDRILEYAGQGMSGRKIAEQPDIPVSQKTVNGFLKDHRRERSDATKAIVHEHLAATLPKDLDHLAQLQARLEAIRAANEYDTKLELSVIDRQLKAVDLKLKYSGAGEDDSAARLLEALSDGD
jgi:transposase